MTPPDQGPETPPPRRGRPWLRVALFASLAVNLLILGAVAGAVLGRNNDKQSSRPPSTSLVRDLGLGPYFRALETSDRGALRKAADSQRATLREGRQEMRQAFSETLELLRAETLDPERLLTVIERQASVAERGRELGQRLLVERIQAMSVAERRGLAERLEQSVRQGRHGKPPHHKK